MECCNYDPKRFFLFFARLLFGSWLLYVGLTKWIFFGADGFVGFITTDFDKTWSPHALNVFLAWVILIAEPVLALWLLSGKVSRKAWMSTTLLMFMLTIGQTILMKPDVIANWQYVIFCLWCAAISDKECATL